MEVKQKLSDITTGLIQVLKTKKYRETCIKKFIHTWVHLENYMIRSGFTSYSKDVGEAFIKDRFGDVSYHDLKKYEKEKVRHVQVLSDYQESGDISRHRLKVTGTAFSGKLGAPFIGFIEYSRAIKRSESTVQRYKERIKTLYIDLQQSGKGIADINAPYMVPYLSRLDKTRKDTDRNNILMTIRVFLRYLCGAIGAKAICRVCFVVHLHTWGLIFMERAV
jgi:integrase/recombinase XerD